jgi:hypothetical protein
LSSVRPAQLEKLSVALLSVFRHHVLRGVKPLQLWNLLACLTQLQLPG